ncbi:hypothetical protein C5167_035568 [Papaver somniferum]|uniref:Uncharacterized protein n=1 Tax=Papaver somniferum TaxID=3469 RepID=A0A4Y7KIG7_PAPSO|nr:hypothetical protein C5167_035568 [Papaver somniferum]
MEPSDEAKELAFAASSSRMRQKDGLLQQYSFMFSLTHSYENLSDLKQKSMGLDTANQVGKISIARNREYWFCSSREADRDKVHVFFLSTFFFFFSVNYDAITLLLPSDVSFMHLMYIV